MRVLIKEEQQQRLKLQPFIYKAIASKRTSLGDNPALPPYGDFGFEYDVVKKSYEEADEIINNMIENGELESKDPDYLVSVLSKLINECKKEEEPIRPQLQKLCENIVNETFSVPSDTVILNCKLVGKIKPKKDMRILPEDGDEENGYDFNDVDEVEFTNKIILKRRFINSLIQGFSYWLSTDIDDWYDTVNNLNDKIWGLWYNIKFISDYLLFVKEEKINEKNPSQLSYVEVTLGRNGKKTIIEAQGIIFPYLLRETFRGFFELFSSHGLPEDNQKAMYIIRKADFLVAEPWDLRLGMGIINILQNSLTKKYETELMFKTNRIPFFFSYLCKLETDEFNTVIKNFLLGTKKGKILAKDIDARIVHDDEYQMFKDRIQQKNINTSLISDDCMTKEELDDYVIEEDMDEMMAYHGSGADFDKFNHKKYLNTGAGSQAFGWGTYVTNDEAVANGYSESSKRIPKNKYHELILDYLVNKKGMPNNFETEKAADEYNNKLMADYRSTGGFDELKDIYEDWLISRDLTDEFRNMLEMFICVLSNNKKNEAFLYEVDIPEDNGTNYIEWYEHFPPQFMKRIIQGFLRIPGRYLDLIAKNNYPFSCDLYKDIQWIKQNPDKADKMISIICSNDSYEDFFSSSYYTEKPNSEGKNIYSRLRTLFKSNKAASLFLMQCGFDGIKYPSGTMWKKPDGASEDAYNYVIFDANKVKIINKTKV